MDAIEAKSVTTRALVCFFSIYGISVKMCASVCIGTRFYYVIMQQYISLVFMKTSVHEKAMNVFLTPKQAGAGRFINIWILRTKF